MGLAPYGNNSGERVTKYEELIRSHLVDLKDDGSIWLNQAYFTYATGLRMVKDKKWNKLFGLEKEILILNLLRHIVIWHWLFQNITEDIVVRMVAEAKKLTGCDSIVLQVEWH